MRSRLFCFAPPRPYFQRIACLLIRFTSLSGLICITALLFSAIAYLPHFWDIEWNFSRELLFKQAYVWQRGENGYANSFRRIKQPLEIYKKKLNYSKNHIKQVNTDAIELLYWARFYLYGALFYLYFPSTPRLLSSYLLKLKPTV